LPLGITKGIGDISYAMKGLDTGFGASLTRVQQQPGRHR
jgi:hypothetical protein